MSIGFDIGSHNVVCARRGEGTKIRYKSQINSFVALPLYGKEYSTALSSKEPLIERDNTAYLIGQSAIDLHFSGGFELRRPIVEGSLNPNEPNSYKVLYNICSGLMGKFGEKETICYSVPSKIIDRNTDVNLQKNLLYQFFKSYRVENKIIFPIHISQGLAVIYAELGLQQRTGIGISFGADLISFCYSVFGTEVVGFSLPVAGNSIDKKVSEAAKVPLDVVQKRKHSINLSTSAIDPVDKLLQSHYGLLIDEFLSVVKQETRNITSTQPLDVIIAGGTTSPEGFVDLFKGAILKMKLTFPVGEVRRASDYNYTVARGCLVAADVS